MINRAAFPLSAFNRERGIPVSTIAEQFLDEIGNIMEYIIADVTTDFITTRLP